MVMLAGKKRSECCSAASSRAQHFQLDFPGEAWACPKAKRIFLRPDLKIRVRLVQNVPGADGNFDFSKCSRR